MLEAVAAADERHWRARFHLGLIAAQWGMHEDAAELLQQVRAAAAKCGRDLNWGGGGSGLRCGCGRAALAAVELGRRLPRSAPTRPPHSLRLPHPAPHRTPATNPAFKFHQKNE